MTTAAAWIAALLLVPAVVWGLLRLGWLVRVALARRRGPEGAEAALRRRLRSAAGRGREQVAVHTALVDLDHPRVCALAREAGYRPVGFERARGPLRGRLGVFVRVGGAVDREIGRAPGTQAPSTQAPGATARFAQR